MKPAPACRAPGGRWLCTADEALALPLAELSRDGGEPGQRGCLLVIERPEFGHSGDDLVGSDGAEASDAGDDVVAPGELFISGDNRRDLGVERGKEAGDLLEGLAAPPLSSARVQFPAA